MFKKYSRRPTYTIDKKTKRATLKITENDVKDQAKDYLTKTGWFSFPLLQGLGSYHGLPDRIAIKNGWVVFIEFKSPTGKQSEKQIEFQTMIELKGGVYLLIDNLDDLMAALDKVLKGVYNK